MVGKVLPDISFLLLLSLNESSSEAHFRIFIAYKGLELLI